MIRNTLIAEDEREGSLSPLESELVDQARKLSLDDLRKIIAQTQALADLSNKVLDKYPYLNNVKS